MKKNIKFGITMVAIFIWCGMMYPELVFTENVIGIRMEDSAGAEDGVQSEDRMSLKDSGGAVFFTAETYRGFLQSEPEQIEVKSRVLEWLEELKENKSPDFKG